MKELFKSVYHFTAPAETIKNYIFTPARIMDYFPLAIKAYVASPSICIIRSWAGATLLEVQEVSPGSLTLEMKVNSALVFMPPFNAEKIKQHAFFTMTEIWELKPLEVGCSLTKTWGDIIQHRLKFLPIEKQILASIEKEEKLMVARWDNEYKKEHI